MLLSYKTVHAAQLDAAYATHMVLHSRYRISIEGFRNLCFDGSVLKRAIPEEPCERNWLIVPLEGEVQIGAGGREVALRAGECLVELNHRTEYLRYRPALNLTLEWEPDLLGSPLLAPGDPFRFSAKNLRRLQRLVASLQRSDVSLSEAGGCIRELMALLRAEGLPFHRAEPEELLEEVPAWMRAISGALDRSLSDLSKASILDLQAILGWSSATVRRRLGEFRSRYSYKTIRFREILHLRRLVTGAALLGAPAATTEAVAGILGYGSPNAFYDALATPRSPHPPPSAEPPGSSPKACLPCHRASAEGREIGPSPPREGKGGCDETLPGAAARADAPRAARTAAWRKAIPFLSQLGVSLFIALSAHGAFASPDPLRVGLTGVYPPFNYIEPSGALAGFDVEIAKELCARLERPCAFEVLQWDGILSALLAGRIDVVIGSMAITPQREEQVRFTRPYYESGAQLFRRPGAPEPERPGFRLGVTLGTTYGEVARERFPEAKLRTYKGDVAALQDLRAGRLDGLVTDRLVGLHMNERYRAGLQPHGAPLFDERIGIPVHPDEPELLQALNDALAELRASPRYEALHRQFFGAPGEGAVLPEGEGAFTWAGSIRLLLRALWTTLQVSALGILLGILLAVVLAALLLVAPPLLARPVAFYVDFIRSTPFLIQLFTLYFGLPAIGVDLGAWSAAVLAIGVHSSAYLSEIAKVAYQSVPVGQRHAARTLGLNRREELLRVVWPQMQPQLTAPCLNTLVAMIKDSAIVSVIGVHELTMQAQQLISVSFLPMEFYALTALLYFAVTYPLLLAGRTLERRYRAQGLLHAH